MAQTATERKELLLNQLRSKLPAPPVAPHDSLKITQNISPARLADIDNLLGIMNSSEPERPLSAITPAVGIETSDTTTDLRGAVLFYTSFGGGTIHPAPKQIIKLPYTTKDPAMIALIKSTYAIGSLTCPVRMKELG